MALDKCTIFANAVADYNDSTGSWRCEYNQTQTQPPGAVHQAEESEAVSSGPPNMTPTLTTRKRRKKKRKKASCSDSEMDDDAFLDDAIWQANHEARMERLIARERQLLEKLAGI